MASAASIRDDPGTAVSLAHPARLAAWAALHGVGAWRGGAFRYLELGAGDAANLLPLAAQFPEATFVGVDRDAARVDRGRRAAEACGIANLTLFAEDVRAFDPPGGAFDFVVAHGVYSWVEREVQERLFALMAGRLAPLGVGYLSYNTLPGWAVRGVVRHMMRDAARGAATDADRLRAARSRVAQLQRVATGAGDPYTALLALELESIREKPDAYLLSEHLAEHNEAVYFKDLVQRAGAHGLAYLCEMMPATAEGGLEIDLPAELGREGMSRVDAEQALDVLAYRQLRCTLFCHENAAPSPAPDFALLAHAGHFMASLTPTAEEPLLGPGKALRFRARTGAEIEVHRPLLKAALLAIAEAWPEGRTARALIGAAMALLRERGLLEAAEIDEAEIEQTVRDVVALCRRRLLEISPWSPRVEREIAARPAVSPLTRIEAARSGIVTTPMHEPRALAEPVRTVAGLLDGARDLRAIVAELSARIDSGELAIDGQIPPGQRAAILAEIVAAAVVEIRDLGLLVDPTSGAAGAHQLPAPR